MGRRSRPCRRRCRPATAGPAPTRRCGGPASGRPGVIERLRPGLGRALSVDDVHGAGQDVGIGLVEDDEDVGVAQLEVPFRLGLVVEAQDGRGGAPAQDPAAGLQAFGEGREAEGAPFLRRRQGWMRSRASVMTPSVPSLPTKSWVRFGPGGGAGPLPSVCTTRPSASTTSRPMHHVLDLPVAGRVLPRPAAGQPAADGGEVHGLRPVAERVARTDLAERALEIRAEGAGPHVGREGDLVDLRRPSSAVMSRATPPCTGIEPPQTPLRPAAGRDRHGGLVAGREHGRHLLRRARGAPPRPGAAGTPPSAAQPMASGHQSRPASARASSSVTTSAPLAASRSSSAGGTSTTGAPRRSATSAPAGVDGGDRRRLGHAGRARP